MPLLQPQENHAPGLLPSATIRLLLIEFLPPQSAAQTTVSLAEVPDFSFDITHVNFPEDVIENVDDASFDALVWRHPQADWKIMDRIASITDLHPGVPLILLIDSADEEFALESLRRGAQDCLALEQCDNTWVARTIVHAIERKQMIGAACNGCEVTERHDWKKMVSDLVTTHSKLEQEGEKRKRVENVLQHERNYIYTILDTIDALVVVLNAKGIIIEFNKAFEKISGYTFPEVQGCNYWDVMLPCEESDTACQVFSGLRAEDYPNRHENYICTKNNNRRLISWSNTALSGNNNNIEYVIATGIDITEQRQAEEDLWSYYNQLAEMVEGRTSELLQANSQLQKEIYDHEKTEHELQHHRDHLEELVAERTRELKTTLMKLDNEIQERKQAEATEKKHLMETAHVSRVNTMGEMISEISHELNQPLAAISIYSDACMRLLASGNAKDEEITSALQDISHQTKRADQVIKRVREFARRKETRLVDMGINELVKEVIHMIEIDTRWHGVELQVLMSDPLPDVSADRILIEQVILNLVRNAIEAMESIPEGNRKLCIRTVGNRTSVEVSVLDTGHGFSELDEAGVFEPFVTTKANGVGMGLAICTSIINSHGGRLWAEPNPEGGAVFRFVLPVKDVKNHEGIEGA